MNKTELENLRDEIKELKEQYKTWLNDVSYLAENSNDKDYFKGRKGTIEEIIEDLEEILSKT